MRIEGRIPQTTQANKRISEFDEMVHELVGSDSLPGAPEESAEGVSSLEDAETSSILEELDTDWSESAEPEVAAAYAEMQLEEEVESEEDTAPIHPESEQTSSISGQIHDLSQSLGAQFSAMDTQMQKLMREFQTKLMIDAQKDQVIDNLHRELQEYKNNENQDRFLPLIRDLISLIDKLEKGLADNKRNGNESPEKLLDIIKYTVQDVDDILYRQGIEALPPLRKKFDPKRHKVVKTVKTSDKEKDKQIAHTFGKAYVWDERQIRQELVAVYIYQPVTD
ncbi:nucleotide exchange factor GrpE [Cytobacillus oceanisediminis]|uniref:nucleotide exchange factor GrpE n=1 Tax=Cytobacillus oceanisediminis TaxID=665099 RepID=UPI002494072F|nr:nucleotide exchange factor GrpE [Cytobacillus oceanisediminis]